MRRLPYMPEGMPYCSYIRRGRWMNDLADSMEAVAYAAKAVGVEAVPSPENRFSARLRKISSADIFSSNCPVSSACAATLAEKRSIAVLDGLTCIDELAEAVSMRIPLVIANASISMGFHSLHNDCSDIMPVKDLNIMIFLPENNQEILDNVVHAYRICEDSRVLLPAIINAEMPETREVVQIPSDQAVENMLPRLRLPSRIDTKKPCSFNPPVGDYTEQRIQQFKAMENAAGIVKKAFEKWDEKFHRKYGFFEGYMVDDAEYIFVVAGYNSGAVRSAVNSLRAGGEKAGMLRIRVLRPFATEINDILKGRKVAIIDPCGLLSEIRAPLMLFTAGKCLSEKDVISIFAKMKKSESGRLWLQA
ncbi:MAG: hypothetical protein QMD85_05585 [Candidatus Aenigmarchaeota archaeon]|nr:hypothetical protein [Candidatus Aenigmarchaeota archaeon]